MPITSRNAVLGGIIAAVAAWGVVHAIGHYRSRGELRGSAIILAWTALFLGGWMLALAATRRRRRRRQAPPRG